MKTTADTIMLMKKNGWKIGTPHGKEGRRNYGPHRSNAAERPEKNTSRMNNKNDHRLYK